MCFLFEAIPKMNPICYTGFLPNTKAVLQWTGNSQKPLFPRQKRCANLGVHFQSFPLQKSSLVVGYANQFGCQCFPRGNSDSFSFIYWVLLVHFGKVSRHFNSMMLLTLNISKLQGQIQPIKYTFKNCSSAIQTMDFELS